MTEDKHTIREAAKARLEQIEREKRGQDRDVLNVEMCAEFLGFNPYTVRELARKRVIPGRKIGREWRFSRRRLLGWIEGASW